MSIAETTRDRSLSGLGAEESVQCPLTPLPASPRQVPDAAADARKYLCCKDLADHQFSGGCLAPSPIPELPDEPERLPCGGWAGRPAGFSVA